MREHLLWVQTVSRAAAACCSLARSLAALYCTTLLTDLHIESCNGGSKELDPVDKRHVCIVLIAFEKNREGRHILPFHKFQLNFLRTCQLSRSEREELRGSLARTLCEASVGAVEEKLAHLGTTALSITVGFGLRRLESEATQLHGLCVRAQQRSREIKLTVRGGDDEAETTKLSAPSRCRLSLTSEIDNDEQLAVDIAVGSQDAAVQSEDALQIRLRVRVQHLRRCLIDV